MKRTFLLLALTAWVAAWAVPAAAVELNTPVADSLTIVETLRVLDDITDSSEEFWALVNRLNLQVCRGSFIAGLRYDTEVYLLPEEYYVRYVPEKFFLQYDERPFLVRVGDSYVRFGQGLTLSLLKRDEFGEDSTIQGFLFQMANDYFEVETVVGPVNLGDDRSFKPVRAQTEEPEFIDERDLVWGGRIMGGYPGIIKAGGAYVGSTLRHDEESQFAEYEEDDRVNIYSLIFDAPDLGGYGAAQGEYAWLESSDYRVEPLDDIEFEGRGAHLAMTWYLGPVTLLTEATDYYRFTFPYNEPPSMEYAEVSFGHLPNYDDAIGARGRVDYTIPTIDLAVFVNYTNIQTHEELPGELADHYGGEIPWREWIEHTYGGIDHTFANGAFAKADGGYREIPEGRYVHGEIDAETPIVYPHSINAAYKIKQFHGFDIMKDVDYSDHEGSVGYGWAPYFSLTGTYEWSDEPAGGIIEVGATKEDDPHFWAVESTIQPADWARISLAYGRYKGGIKCSGGVCRQLPPFEGLRSEFALRF